MSTFLKSLTDVTKAGIFGPSGDDRRPGPGEAFVYLGTRAPLVIRHDTIFDRRDTARCRRYHLNLEEIPVNTSVVVRLPLNHGSVTATLKGHGSLWNDKEELAAYAQDPFDLDVEVRRLLAEEIESTGRRSMIELDQEYESLGSRIVKRLEPRISRSEPARRSLRLSITELKIEMDAEAQRRLVFERKYQALKRDIQSLNLMEAYRARLTAADTSETLDALRATLGAVSEDASRLEALRKEARELRDDLKRRFALSITGHEAHVIDRSMDASAVEGLRDELRSRVEFQVEKESLASDIKALGLERTYEVKIRQASNLSDLAAVRSSLPQGSAEKNEFDELKRQCQAAQRELEKLGIHLTPSEAREFGEARTLAALRTVLSEFKSRLAVEDLRRKCRALVVELRSDYRVEPTRDEESDLSDAGSFKALDELYKTLRNRRDIYRLVDSVQSKNMPVPQELIDATLATGTPEAFASFEKYILDLGQAADLLQFRSDLPLPEPIQKFFFTALREEYLRNGNNMLKAVKTVLVHLVGGEHDNMGLGELIQMLPRTFGPVATSDRAVGEGTAKGLGEGKGKYRED